MRKSITPAASPMATALVLDPSLPGSDLFDPSPSSNAPAEGEPEGDVLLSGHEGGGDLEFFLSLSLPLSFLSLSCFFPSLSCFLSSSSFEDGDGDGGGVDGVASEGGSGDGVDVGGDGGGADGVVTSLVGGGGDALGSSFDGGGGDGDVSFFDIGGGEEGGGSEGVVLLEDVLLPSVGAASGAELILLEG